MLFNSFHFFVFFSYCYYPVFCVASKQEMDIVIIKQLLFLHGLCAGLYFNPRLYNCGGLFCRDLYRKLAGKAAERYFLFAASSPISGFFACSNITISSIPIYRFYCMVLH